MRHFIENHFGVVLVLSCVAGLYLPGLPDFPDSSAIWALAALTFIACYKLQDGRMEKIGWVSLIAFCLLRYTLLPAVMWLIASYTVPDYAMGIFLLAVLPPAVSSPAFTNIFGGSVALSFSIVIVSTLIAPGLIPFQFSWLGNDVVPEARPLFETLGWSILAPIIVYLLVSWMKPLAANIQRNNKLYSIILLFFIIALIIAKQRSYILSDLEMLILPFELSVGCFAIFILFGWYFARKRPPEERITFAVCSGFNNAALGVSLALMHFPAKVVLFIAVSEMAWALLPAMLGFFLKVLR